MDRDARHSPHPHKAIAPYAQAIEAPAGRMVFLSGQTPLDPATMKLVDGTVAQQTERVLENLQAVLAAGGLDFSNVVRCGVFLTDMRDFAEMNAVYGRYFPGTPPARTTVEVRGLPMGARVEIDCIAVRPG